MKGYGGFSAALRAEYFNDASARDAADAESDVKRKDSAWDDLNRVLHFVSETHDGAVTEFSPYLTKGLRQYVFFGYRLFCHLSASIYSKFLLFDFIYDYIRVCRGAQSVSAACRSVRPG